MLCTQTASSRPLSAGTQARPAARWLHGARPVQRMQPAQASQRTSSASQIVVVPGDDSLLKAKGVKSWPTWGHGVDKFDWTYDSNEDSYVIKGRVIVTPTGGEPVEIKAGDYVTFPAGMSCVWDIKEPILKHYSLY